MIEFRYLSHLPTALCLSPFSPKLLYVTDLNVCQLKFDNRIELVP